MNIIDIGAKGATQRLTLDTLVIETVGQQGQVGGTVLALRGRGMGDPQVFPMHKPVILEAVVGGVLYRVTGCIIVGVNAGRNDKGDAKVELHWGQGDFEAVPAEA